MAWNGVVLLGRAIKPFFGGPVGEATRRSPRPAFLNLLSGEDLHK